MNSKSLIRLSVPVLFPMGILNKLVLILKKLDPENEYWKQRQIAQAEKIPDLQSQEIALAGINQVFSKANQYNNYGRKLYLIQNCIYGVDIQSIAVTVAKLRFFISLVIEQESNDNQDVKLRHPPTPQLRDEVSRCQYSYWGEQESTTTLV